MPSKVLTGEAAEQVQPIAWRKLLPDASLHGSAGAPAFAEESALDQSRLAELEKDAERREQQAFTAGFRKGEAAGQDEAKARLDPVIGKLAQTITSLGESRRTKSSKVAIPTQRRRCSHRGVISGIGRRASSAKASFSRKRRACDIRPPRTTEGFYSEGRPQRLKPHGALCCNNHNSAVHQAAPLFQ